MKCPVCQSENRSGRRFCAECGAALALACPKCGFANDPGEKFCGGCGARLAPASAATADVMLPQKRVPAGERRQVTIMFADLSGYTRLSEALDAEDLHETVGRVLAAIDRTVESHGGTVHRHIGDEVMALFGAPVAHSDDPYRAVLAAHESHRAVAALSAELGRELAIHVGIASGEVIVAEQGAEDSGEGADYAVTGVAANLASRLTAMAEPRETVISEAVYRAVERHVTCESLGTVEVKGIEKPVSAWRFIGSSAEMAGSAGGRFVGRRAELAQFAGALAASRNDGIGQAVLLRGEAGIGKTRLLEEFQTIAESHGFACHKSLVLDFGVGKGQDAIGGLVARMMEVPVGAHAVARQAFVLRAVADGVVEADQRPFLNDLLDLPQPPELKTLYDAMDNAARAEARNAVIHAVMRNCCARRPRFLAIEDIHWADAATLSDLARITRAVQDCGAVLVMTSRIEGDPLDHAWRSTAGGASLMTMDLGPLREAEALELAGAFTDSAGEFVRHCVARAEGSPLFLEQLLRAAEESLNRELPGTIQSLVMARMDQLEPADKSALQAAAVIGQRFSLEALREVMGDPGYSCESLIKHYLVRPEGEDFLFVHALIRDGVYGSLLRARKHALHGRAAAWFAERDEVLHAEHLARAEDPAAPEAYLEAARGQAAEYRYERALETVGRGIDIAEDRKILYRLTCLRGAILHDLGNIAESLTAYGNALEYADRDEQRCRARIGLAAGMRVLDRYDEALGELARAEEAAVGSGLARELAQIHHLRGNLYFPMGKIERCREQHELALKFAREAGSPEDEAQALSGLGDAAYASGRMITASQQFRGCVALCRQHGFGRIEVANLNMIGFSRLYSLELKEALEDAQATIDLAQNLGHQRAELLGRTLTFHVLFEWGELADAWMEIEACNRLVEGLGSGRFEAQNLIYRSKILRQQGRRDEALATADQAIALCRETGPGFVGPRAYAEYARNCDDPAARRNALDEGEKILRDGAVSHNHFHYYRDAMDVHLDAGEWSEVERYASALEEFTRSEPLPWGEFFVTRARALVRYGQGERGADVIGELRILRQWAESARLAWAIPALAAALAE